MENQSQIAIRGWNEDTTRMMRKLKRYVSQLQSKVPSDQMQRPLGLINVDYLMSTGLLQPLDEMMESDDPSLYLPISYMEGMPTIYGVPIWEKLENEPLEYYELFKKYRMLMGPNGQRSIHKLHLESGVDMINLELLRQNYFWQMRVSAYDVYRKQEREFALEVFRDEVQEKHRNTANRLFTMATDVVMSNPQMLTPKVALDWAKLAIELERISVGLNPDKPGTIAEGPATVVNIQNNVGQAHGTGVTGDVEEDRLRLKQMINVMNNIGLLKTDSDIIDVEVEEVVDNE